MKAITKRLTYANVMSSIAVFLVLGGATAFAAAQLGKNSVGTKQLKKNAVTTAKIKKNAVTTAKIKKSAVNAAKIKPDAVTTAKIAANAVTTEQVKDGAITGAKVNTATLGTVPSAANLAGFDRTGIVRLNATAGATKEAALAAAPETPLYSAGPLTLYAKCTLVTGTLAGWIFVKTSVDGVIFDSDYDEAYGEPYLNTTTPEAEREVLENNIGADSASIYGVHTPGFQAMAPDGTSAFGWNIIAVKQGTISGGDGIYGPGNVCLFSGELTTLNL